MYLEGFREGAEEFKQSGELDKAITKGLGGFAESITFGLVDSDSAVEGASFIGRRLGLIDETMDEEVERLKKKIAEAKDRITRSEGGENVYKLMESRGRKMDSIAIRQAEHFKN